jgi:7-keto-8-aminopelargonate synthetase-like enzyme
MQNSPKTLMPVKGIPGRSASVNGEDYLFFSGFAYLGMPSLPAFQQLIAEGAKSHGAVFPSSRISNTPSVLYEDFESALSTLTGLPASASFSAGYMASQAAAFFASQNSELLYAPGAHPSLRIAGQQIPPLVETDWRQQIIAIVNHHERQNHTIVLESVNPLSGEVHDLSWLKEIRRPVRLLIYDSHGIGLLGDRGEGIMAYLPPPGRFQYLISYSLSKAFSCEGGALSGGQKDIDGIKKLPWFTAATGMSPLFAGAWMQARPLFARQKERLRAAVDYFHRKAAGIPALRHDPRLPVAAVGDPGVYAHCLKHHILLSAFRYPSPQDPLMARIVLNALHTTGDIDRLCACLRQYFKA